MLSHKTILFWLSIVTVVVMSSTGTIVSSASAHRNKFAAQLMRVVAAERPQENVVFSPASIQSCLALTYMGANGKTAAELRDGIFLPGDKTTVAEDYNHFLRSNFGASPPAPVLRMVNRIYVNELLPVDPRFNQWATQYFDALAEHARFSDAAATVNKINKWVQQQTENKIRDVMPPNGVNADTSAVVVNAIYFKGKWQMPFSASSTHKAQFMSGYQPSTVNMMYLDERLRYAELPELDAVALELPYENSALSMLIVLPRTTTGLQQLEVQLATVDLNHIDERMRAEDVDVFLPKFKIEFDIGLKQPLQKLGVTSMFSNYADLSDLFQTKTPQKISDVRHKAFIDVNEAGSEAAAASYVKIVPMSLNLDKKVFKADHPFFFAIRDKRAVYFAGHVSRL